MDGARITSSEPIAIARINGKDFTTFHQKFVSVLGTAGDSNPDGRSFKMTTLDGTPVVVRMSQGTISELISGFVEVEGKVLGKAMIDCTRYGMVDSLVKKNETTKDLDPATFSQAIEACIQNPRHYVSSPEGATA